MTNAALPSHRRRLSALRPLVAALAVACMAWGPQAQAAPPVAHWTVIDLGTLGGSRSDGYGINAAGQVTGTSYTFGSSDGHAFLYGNGAMSDLGTLGGRISYGNGINAAGLVTGASYIAGNGALHAFRYSRGAMTDLGTLGGTSSEGHGINDSGQVTGNSETAGNTAQHAFLYSNDKLTDLGTLGGSSSYGFGINAAGQVAGVANTAGGGSPHAFMYSNGAMTDLGTLGGTYSYGYGINATGQVTGIASTSGDVFNHAFLYSHGAMTDLGTLGGRSSNGTGINDAGQVIGYADTAGNAAQHAFLYSNGKMTDLNGLNGVAASGATLVFAKGINDFGQILVNGTNASGQGRALVLTLDTTVWEGGSAGSFASVSGWSFLTAPNSNTAVFIDPTASATITGPSVNTDIRQLTVGGDGSGNNGIATLSLNGGTINVLGNGGRFTAINAKGVLTGDGTIIGVVTNLGTVNAVNLSLPGGLTNLGTVTGDGLLSTSLANTSSGLVRVDAGQTLKLSGNAHSNSGSVEVRNGGELQVNGAFTNAATGRVVLNSGLVRFNTGLMNNGQLQVSFGGGEVFGAITNNSGGKIILSGNSNTTFYDSINVQQGGELRVSGGSTAVFFGAVYQRTGSLFTGTGQSFYEGGLQVGNSPGLGANAGSVAFGAGNVYEAEIGGTGLGDAQGNGIAFDRYNVAGTLTFGGTLKLVSWNGFTGQAGQSVDLFDWGSASGAFNAIDASGLQLAAGTRLDLSRLYVDGVVAVQAVPEPGTWAMWLAGMAWLGFSVRGCSAHFRRNA